MNVLRLSKRHFIALLTIVGALSMVIYSTAHASDTPSNHHSSVPDVPYVAPLNDPITITILGFAFTPNNITIPTGTTVTWANLDGVPHTSTSTSVTPVWNSGNLTTNQTFSFTFNSAGIFPYRCNIHTSMTGTITVVDPTNTPTATFTNTSFPPITLSPIASNTPTRTATSTPSLTNTPSSTATSTATNTASVTASLTNTPTNTVTPIVTNTATNTALPPRPDTIGVYLNGRFYLRNTNNGGAADITTLFGGAASDLPVAGDWNGDGVDTIGVYRNDSGFYYLSDSNTSPTANYTVLFGNPGDTPFAGKWTADMTHDGLGVYRNSNGILYQKKDLTTGFSDYFAIYGNPDDKGIAGDWDGDGFDSIGIFRISNGTWYLSNNSTPSGITFSDISFVWNIYNSLPVVGDWDANGITTVGAFETVFTDGYFELKNENASQGVLNSFAFGPIGGKPIAGKWIAASQPNRANVNIGLPGGIDSNPSGGVD